jgi:hypothetical protein
MAQPVFYQTLNMVGIDPTIYYTNLATAGGSFTPEYPAPPYIAGTQAFGSDGSQFVFCQASTTINLTDFVIINAGDPSNAGTVGSNNTYMANSATTALALTGSRNVALASTGLVLKQSVSYIPAGAMFWACTRGQFIPASNSATNSNSAPGTCGLATGSGNIVLYTTQQAGCMSTTASVASSNSTASAAFAGFCVISSLSISTSIAPPAGTLSNGFTVGPVVSMNNPRTIAVAPGQTLATATNQIATIYW